MDNNVGSYIVVDSEGEGAKLSYCGPPQPKVKGGPCDNSQDGVVYVAGMTQETHGTSEDLHVTGSSQDIGNPNHDPALTFSGEHESAFRPVFPGNLRQPESVSSDNGNFLNTSQATVIREIGCPRPDSEGICNPLKDRTVCGKLEREDDQRQASSTGHHSQEQFMDENHNRLKSAAAGSCTSSVDTFYEPANQKERECAESLDRLSVPTTCQSNYSQVNFTNKACDTNFAEGASQWPPASLPLDSYSPVRDFNANVPDMVSPLARLEEILKTQGQELSRDFSVSHYIDHILQKREGCGGPVNNSSGQCSVTLQPTNVPQMRTYEEMSGNPGSASAFGCSQQPVFFQGHQTFQQPQQMQQPVNIQGSFESNSQPCQGLGMTLPPFPAVQPTGSYLMRYQQQPTTSVYPQGLGQTDQPARFTTGQCRFTSPEEPLRGSPQDQHLNNLTSFQYSQQVADGRTMVTSPQGFLPPAVLSQNYQCLSTTGQGYPGEGGQLLPQFHQEYVESSHHTGKNVMQPSCSGITQNFAPSQQQGFHQIELKTSQAPVSNVQSSVPQIIFQSVVPPTLYQIPSVLPPRPNTPLQLTGHLGPMRMQLVKQLSSFPLITPQPAKPGQKLQPPYGKCESTASKGWQGAVQKKRKKHTAKHLLIQSLQIGKWKYEADFKHSLTARMKTLFAQKKFVYELQINDVMAANIENKKQLATIEVLFRNVVNITFKESEMSMEVLHPPRMYLGVKDLSEFPSHHSYNSMTAKYDRSKGVDLTDGELTTSPYHKIVFRQPVCSRMKESLISYDSKFETLISSVFVEVPGKILEPEPKRHSKKYKVSKGDKHGGASASASTPSSNQSPVLAMESRQSSATVASTVKDSTNVFPGCMCRILCVSKKCSCVKLGIPCTPKCTCGVVKCNNSFTVLNRLGYDLHDVRRDACLMWYLDKRPEGSWEIKLAIDVEMPCCKQTIKLKEVFPGSIKCKYCEKSSTQYEYSWCHRRLCVSNTSYPIHCRRCNKCVTEDDTMHCKTCGTCRVTGPTVTGEKQICSDCQQKTREKRHAKKQ